MSTQKPATRRTIETESLLGKLPIYRDPVVMGGDAFFRHLTRGTRVGLRATSGGKLEHILNNSAVLEHQSSTPLRESKFLGTKPATRTFDHHGPESTSQRFDPVA